MIWLKKFVKPSDSTLCIILVYLYILWTIGQTIRSEWFEHFALENRSASKPKSVSCEHTYNNNNNISIVGGCERIRTRVYVWKRPRYVCNAITISVRFPGIYHVNLFRYVRKILKEKKKYHNARIVNNKRRKKLRINIDTHYARPGVCVCEQCMYDVEVNRTKS